MFKVEQLQVGGFDHNFSYLVMNGADAALIDPCGSDEIIFAALEKAGVTLLRYILITHGHADHISALDAVLRRFPSATVAAHPLCGVRKAVALADGQRLGFGDGFIETLYAPGHTPDSVLYRLSDDTALFTGDTLFVDCCGYCNPDVMFQTMRQVIFPLADTLVVYSGHDYGDFPFRTLGIEKVSNPYLNTADYTCFLARIDDL